jgi:hypothetical protein
MSTERHKLNHVWNQMRARCTNPNNQAFPNYGARGITVCPEWMESFDRFLADMGPRPEGGLLDRIDNNAGYSAQNCRWTDRKTQNSNRRNCILIEDGDERITLKEACRRRGLKYRPVVKRIQYRGWSIDRALSEPIKQQGSNAK